MNEPWRFTLFGGLSARQADRIVTRFKSQKIGALLAYLAVHLRQTHSRELLIELLWPESSLEAGRNSLSVALSSLRHQFEPPGTPTNSVIRADRFSVSLNPAAVTTDVFEFEQAIKDAARGTSERQREEQLIRTLELYQGPLLPAFYEDWILGERERLATQFLEAATRLVQVLESGGQVDSAITYARRAVSVDPLREEAQHTLIRLLVTAGQPSTALRQYHEYERLLEEELSSKPGPQLRVLAEQIQKRIGTPAAAPESSVPQQHHAVPLTGPSTVTFLLTELDGGSAGPPRALEDHHRLLREAFNQHGGQEVRESSSGFMVVFAGAVSALRAAILAQQVLAAHPWPESLGGVRVRMALHSGDVEESSVQGAYQNPVLQRANRLLSTAHGGQTLLSEETAGLVRRDLPSEVSLHDLGMFRLPDQSSPERLFQVQHPGMVQPVFPPLHAERGQPTSGIPLTFTRFFGREKELARLQELLDSPGGPRLITVTGPGGTGKTRVSIEAARQAAASSSTAVCFVPLADISDPSQIAGAILDSMRVPRSPRQEPMDQVVDVLHQKPVLLVLDNFEQLVESGGPEVVQTLLERIPELKLLVTSRQVLSLSAEREFVLSPLPTPTGSEDAERLSAFDSVLLFIDRAQQVMPDFQVTNHNAAAVAELVSRLEGIPLAIELAAARVLALTPLQMLSQLKNRFDFLAGRKRDVVERHRTLWAAVDWSYQLLSPELRRFFCRLSVFRGGWTLEAAEAVCEEPLALDYLAQLGECSLALSEETKQGMRFRMLETLREFAWEQLQAEERILLQQRHSEYFLAFAEQADSHLAGKDQAIWLKRLELDSENLGTVLDLTILAKSVEEVVRLCWAVSQYWWVRGCASEGRSQWERALRMTRVHDRTWERASALNGAGKSAALQCDYAPARLYLEESLSIYRELENPRGIANTLVHLGDVMAEQGDLTNARNCYEESLTICRELGIQRIIATHLNSLGNLAHRQGDYDSAQTYCEESLKIGRALDNPKSVASSLGILGIVSLFQGDYATARSYMEEGLAINRSLGGRVAMANSLGNLGLIAAAQGEFTYAEDCYKESLALSREIENKSGVAAALVNLGDMAMDQGDLTGARPYYEESLSIFRTIGSQVGIASVLGSLGILDSRQGNYDSARLYLKESLSIFRNVGDRAAMASMVKAFASVAAGESGLVESVTLWGAAESLREMMGAPLPPNEQAMYQREVDWVRQALGEEAFAAAWVEGRELGWEVAVARALGESTE